MTTNKPEVVSIYNTATGESEEVIRLSDYEALQTECEKLRKDAERYRWLRDPCSGAERKAEPWIPVSERLLDAYAQISKRAERMSNRDCNHGQLARSCNICELEEEVIEKAITIAALEREVERLKKDAARLRPALEETVKSLEIISQQAGESRGLSTFTQIKQYALDWVRTVRKDLAAGEAG